MLVQIIVLGYNIAEKSRKLLWKICCAVQFLVAGHLCCMQTSSNALAELVCSHHFLM